MRLPTAGIKLDPSQDAPSPVGANARERGQRMAKATVEGASATTPLVVARTTKPDFEFPRLSRKILLKVCSFNPYAQRYDVFIHVHCIHTIVLNTHKPN